MRRSLYLVEIVRALAVLAVVFLNFAAAPATAAGFADDTASWCGAPAEGDNGGHFSCASCRIDSAIDLPPRFELAMPAAIVIGPARPAICDASLERTVTPPPARGPPLA